MQQSSCTRERLLSYCQQRKQHGHHPPLDLSGCDLSEIDLSGLDLRGVNLTGANLARARLDGAQLQAATLLHTCFAGIPVKVLLAAGLSPRFLLQQRAEADRRAYPPLHFSSTVSSPAPLQVTARECTSVCQVLRENSWEEVRDEAVFAALYGNELWDDWMARCHTRLILDWALEHRVFLNRTARNIPFYGRVLPLTLLDEVEERDLPAGKRTNPERVLHTLGLRQIIAQSDLQGDNVCYPTSPFGDGEGIVQMKDRRSLQLEGGRMHHCVASYDRQCMHGHCFIYHIGPEAPGGSTLELFPDGGVGQHRAAFNRLPSTLDRARLADWLTSLDLDPQTQTVLERICSRLRQAGIAKVSFQIYWYNDQDIVDDVHAEDQEGQELLLNTVSDDDLWDLAYETQGSAGGQWELHVEEKHLEWVGASLPPDDEDDYDDEDYEEEEEE